MNATLLAVALTVLAADPAPSAQTPREAHPLAPSLPLLSKEEEEKLDDLINRFIKADTGQLRGDEARAAQKEFERLGPEAIPALLRGLNRAAQLEHSCPTLMIAKKLSRMLAATDDLKLLEFARDEIGTGVGRGNKHAGVLAELRTACVLRKNVVLRAAPPPGGNPLRAVPTAELVKSANKESGTQLRAVLAELEQRKGDDVLLTLASAAGTADAEIKQLSRELLERHLARQTPTVLKQKLKDDGSEIRRAAVRVAAKSPAAFTAELIDALADEEGEIRDAAHQALVKLAKGQDLGPAPDADKKQREQAQAKWRAWAARK